MLRYITAAAATVANKTGMTCVAEPDAEPGTVSHIHTVEAVDEHDPADCGYDYHHGDAGAFAPLCWHCAYRNADMPWVQRCLAGSRNAGAA